MDLLKHRFINVINNLKIDSAKGTIFINKITEHYKSSGNIKKDLEYYEKAKQYCFNEKLRVKELEYSRQHITIILIEIILLIVAVVVFVLVKQNRQKNKVNFELGKK
jgi:hypothetical protein